MSTCRRCKHARHAHEHYRSGTDCAACDCARFQRSVVGPVIALVHRRRAAEPVVPTIVKTHAPAA